MSVPRQHPVEVALPGYGVFVLESQHSPDFRMLAGIIETPEGAYYLKAVGPEATMKAARPAFDKMLANERAFESKLENWLAQRKKD